MGSGQSKLWQSPAANSLSVIYVVGSGHNELWLPRATKVRLGEDNDMRTVWGGFVAIHVRDNSTIFNGITAYSRRCQHRMQGAAAAAIISKIMHLLSNFAGVAALC